MLAEHVSELISEHQTCKEATHSSYRVHWKRAMQDKLDSIRGNNAPPACRWLLSRRRRQVVYVRLSFGWFLVRESRTLSRRAQPCVMSIRIFQSFSALATHFVTATTYQAVQPHTAKQAHYILRLKITRNRSAQQQCPSQPDYICRVVERVCEMRGCSYVRTVGHAT